MEIPLSLSAVPATRGLLVTDHVILNHGQETWTTPELAPPLLITTPHQREDVSALDRFSVHRYPTRRVFWWYWARTRDKASHDPIPIQLRAMHVESVACLNSYRCCGVVIRRDGCHLKSHLRHLTMLQISRCVAKRSRGR
ncbi:uncharacterized protein TNCV_2535641 [Trichonephila clavipes]|nr:uncharacterized protein TNCV_2535641 [Trichonephila clavipes]